MTLGIIARYLRVKLGFDGFVNFQGKLIFQNLFVLAEDWSWNVKRNILILNRNYITFEDIVDVFVSGDLQHDEDDLVSKPVVDFVPISL